MNMSHVREGGEEEQTKRKGVKWGGGMTALTSYR
ncbi:hypothetical protein T11_5352 [Trichinella zimbabwensis]|uniref:Uncharacterized protein n=1 Tax=Trichinella zimbabwensis TaxID=268475 RepID=A0A0V1G8X4_9BILA|nr:hypothetical protein T11_5352 [Trichinella zimbabwensis]